MASILQCSTSEAAANSTQTLGKLLSDSVITVPSTRRRKGMRKRGGLSNGKFCGIAGFLSKKGVEAVEFVDSGKFWIEALMVGIEEVEVEAAAIANDDGTGASGRPVVVCV
ncbi:hypothetical protein quinque_008363 [Culex quinquefasciatus]